MKKAYLLFILILISSNLFSQNVQVTQRLANKMNSLNPLEYTRVLILMKDRVDIEKLDKDLYDMNATIEYRAQVVINTLREKAAQTQTPILNYLNAEKESGKIKQMINFWITNLIFIEATPDVINLLTKRSDIEIMDLDAELEMDTPFDLKSAPDNAESVETGLKTIRADSLWRIGITGAGRTVMNIDGGVNGTHPALSPRWWGNNGRQWYHSWFDPIAPVSTSPFDCAAGGTYHGTHTMGIMCGRNTATGDTVGVAPDAYWMAAGVTDCPGASYPSMNIAAYQWAMDPDTNAATMNMPDVISCSWQDPTATDQCTSSIYRTTLTAVEAAGIAVVFSAGNSGPSASTITPPKNINLDSVNVFCVGSVNGTTLAISSFSSRGPSICGGVGTLLIKPEVCAPGESIRSTWSGTTYSSISGTSMAAPHVAGCIALLKQAAPGMTGRQLKAILFSTATDLGTAGEDNNFGKGLVNVYRAYQMLGPVIQHTALANTENLSGPFAVNCTITKTTGGINPSKTRLFWSRNNASITDSLLMTNTSGTNWTANIPGNGSTATYRYYIKTTDSSDRTSTSPAGAPASLNLFVAQTDNAKPVIVHTALTNQPKPNWPATVTATVTDNLGLDSSWVRWNINAGVTKQFKLINTSGSTFTAAFNSVNADVNIGDVISYRIIAQDNSLSHNRDSSALYSFTIIEQFLCEDFSSATFAPTNWNIEFTGTQYWTRSTVSGYGVGTGAAKFDFWTASAGTTQSLVTLTFGNSVSGDSLRFDNAYAPYTDGSTDSLEILTSTNGGTNYSSLVRLWGNNTTGNLNTTAASGSLFTPTSGQWATKRYSLPAGTNKIKFRARSGFGNNLYIDNICKVNNAAPVPATITFAAQGYFDTLNSRLNIRDSATFYLRNTFSPYVIVDSAKSVIDSTSASGTVTFANAVTGTYYLVVKGRNILETWSRSGGEAYVRGSAFSYNFTTASSKAYGNNLFLKGERYCIYSGDVIKNNTVDLDDIIQIYNAANSFTTGFNINDLTGDRTVDLSDVLIAFNNSSGFVSRQAPPGAVIPNDPGINSNVRNSYQELNNGLNNEEPVIIEKINDDKKKNIMKNSE